MESQRKDAAGMRFPTPNYHRAPSNTTPLPGIGPGTRLPAPEYDPNSFMFSESTAATDTPYPHHTIPAVRPKPTAATDRRFTDTEYKTLVYTYCKWVRILARYPQAEYEERLGRLSPIKAMIGRRCAAIDYMPAHWHEFIRFYTAEYDKVVALYSECGHLVRMCPNDVRDQLLAELPPIKAKMDAACPTTGYNPISLMNPQRAAATNTQCSTPTYQAPTTTGAQFNGRISTQPPNPAYDRLVSLVSQRPTPEYDRLFEMVQSGVATSHPSNNRFDQQTLADLPSTSAPIDPPKRPIVDLWRDVKPHVLNPEPHPAPIIQCGICWDNINIRYVSPPSDGRAHDAELLPCGHIFHAQCWVAYRKSPSCPTYARCPTCNFELKFHECQHAIQPENLSRLFTRSGTLGQRRGTPDKDVRRCASLMPVTTTEGKEDEFYTFREPFIKTTKWCILCTDCFPAGGRTRLRFRVDHSVETWGRGPYWPTLSYNERKRLRYPELAMYLVLEQERQRQRMEEDVKKGDVKEGGMEGDIKEGDV
ncbi:hypothetical protein B0T14DRAFT_501094 [Immersiella caudata]|uniref:RING-type domain-containing protein n=1 Tax=Immersiella caudata TaxID=314043 RepID=A0AA39TTN0_9PEZI|nr:hypothetical protein B0T14DRAFT_501094 [Immersiella caudata]